MTAPQISEPKPYWTFSDKEPELKLWPETKEYAKQNNLFVWSARLSTGLFGTHHCVPGNRGPKNKNEVILGLGDSGLQRIVEFGFIPCLACKPHEQPGFWNSIQAYALGRYGITSAEQFADKNILPYDVLRLNWEELFPIVGELPGRFYVNEPKPQGTLTAKELAVFRAPIDERIRCLGVATPELCCFPKAGGKAYRLG